MLSLFPHLLSYTFYVPLLLRIVAGLFFVYMSYRMFNEREKVRATDLPVVGHPAAWLIVLSILVTLATGILLVIGAWTQGAAIVGMIISAKHWAGEKNYSAIVPFARGTYVLLFVICLSLLFSGAGALGVDLPL